MMNQKPTPYGTVRPIVEKFKARGAILLLFDDDNVSGVSYGATKQECKEFSLLLDEIWTQLNCELVGLGELKKNSREPSDG